jgi:glyoxylase-like metal-dependent hydrolase (beta-lactamase superfamily II)
MKITDEVYALDCTSGSYAYVILGKEVTLVDTSMPGRGKAILDELKTLNVNAEDVRNILFTHHDVDHIGNADLLQKTCHADLWASKEDIPYIYGEKARHGIKRFLTSIFKVEIPHNVNPYPEDLKLGEFQIIPTPGHTPGHVCLLYHDTLFAGDLIRTGKGQIKPSPGLMTWDSSLALQSIRQMGQYSFRWVCPAHGIPIERGDLWEKI